MKKNEIKLVITISITLSVILAILQILFLKKNLTIINMVKSTSFALSFVTSFWMLYFYWTWKIPPFSHLFYRPNLNGTWSGLLFSDWEDEHGNLTPPKTFFIVIRQSFLNIHFTTFTDSFIGVSYSETFSLNKDIGLKNVAYLFRKETTSKNNEVLRQGATELRLSIDKTKKMNLKGKFWTNTKTQGEIIVEFISKEKVDSFENAQTLVATIKSKGKHNET